MGLTQTKKVINQLVLNFKFLLHQQKTFTLLLFKESSISNSRQQVFTCSSLEFFFLNQQIN